MWFTGTKTPTDRKTDLELAKAAWDLYNQLAHEYTICLDPAWRSRDATVPSGDLVARARSMRQALKTNAQRPGGAFFVEPETLSKLEAARLLSQDELVALRAYHGKSTNSHVE